MTPIAGTAGPAVESVPQGLRGIDRGSLRGAGSGLDRLENDRAKTEGTTLPGPVLIAGESWIIRSIHIKGFDSFTTHAYEEGV